MAAPGEVVVDVERVGVCGTDIEPLPAICPGEPVERTPSAETSLGH
jgi:threonine dehydrogenase-like Zn-dependent dehydrogenase